MNKIRRPVRAYCGFITTADRQDAAIFFTANRCSNVLYAPAEPSIPFGLTAPQSIDTGISTYFYEGKSYRLCACREYFYRFSLIIIQSYLGVRSGNLFKLRYVSGILPF